MSREPFRRLAPGHILGLVLLVTSVTSCVRGSYYGAGTLIGLNVGTPDGTGLTLGYQKYEVGACGPGGKATVDLIEKMGPEGLSRKQILALGCPERAQTVTIPSTKSALHNELDWEFDYWEEM